MYSYYDMIVLIDIKNPDDKLNIKTLLFSYPFFLITDNPFDVIDIYFTDNEAKIQPNTFNILIHNNRDQRTDDVWYTKSIDKKFIKELVIHLDSINVSYYVNSRSNTLEYSKLSINGFINDNQYHQIIMEHFFYSYMDRNTLNTNPYEYFELNKDLIFNLLTLYSFHKPVETTPTKPCYSLPLKS